MSDVLITRSGYEKLAQELRMLWQVERPEITKKVTWAAGLGDRSENADYQYNKQLLRKIDRRIRYLSKRMEQLKIVDYAPEQAGKVYFGAWVDLENDAGEQVRLRIVGIDEIFQTDENIENSTESLADSHIANHSDTDTKRNATTSTTFETTDFSNHPSQREHWVSIRAPIARALLGKRVDDEVEVRTPLGKKIWYINAIAYTQPN